MYDSLSVLLWRYEEDTAMKLAFKEFGAMSGRSDTAVVMLHGLLGTRYNWHAVAGCLSTTPRAADGTVLAGLDVYAVDLRNHGKSPHSAVGEHSLRTMADDLDGFIATVVNPLTAARRRKVVVVGHSVGAMGTMFAAYRRANQRHLAPHLAAAAAPPAIDAYAVVDSAPTRRPATFGVMAEQIRKMGTMPLHNLRSLQEAEERLTAHAAIADPWTAKYLVSNLARDEPDGANVAPFRWEANVAAVVRALDDKALLWDEQLLESFPAVAAGAKRASAVDAPALFGYGGASAYYTPEAVDAAQRVFRGADVSVLPGAGHFLHIYQMQQYTALLAQFLHKHGLAQPA
jgi:pimeloyl-ACP methyl ester carboxylesterase